MGSVRIIRFWRHYFLYVVNSLCRLARAAKKTEINLTHSRCTFHWKIQEMLHSQQQDMFNNVRRNKTKISNNNDKNQQATFMREAISNLFELNGF